MKQMSAKGGKFLGASVRFWVALIILSGLVATASVSAISTITQGYQTKGTPPLGSIVSLKKDSTDTVDTATPENVNNILGVVVGADNSLISLSSESANQIQVATSGVVEVLVSDINGSIYAGDQITASPISGVGMKATANTKVVGIAQDNLGDNHTDKQTYKDKKGEQHTVKLGQVPVLVNVSYYFKQPEKTIIPSAIQNIANALAGKAVKPLPILVSMGIFIITLIVVVSIIYSMIHSSIISVGRNPMSQSAIYRNLIQLSLLILMILVVAVIAIYMVLTKF
jgi:hypothetical protein